MDSVERTDGDLEAGKPLRQGCLGLDMGARTYRPRWAQPLGLLEVLVLQVAPEVNERAVHTRDVQHELSRDAIIFLSCGAA